MSSPARKILGSQENVFPLSDRYYDNEVKFQEHPPKPPRSAFICFTDAKKKEILSRSSMENNEDYSDEKDVLNIVAKTWKDLNEAERAYWDEEARNDKLRFVREKNDYKGPWNLPKRRAKKHPSAPKRRMSAFLKYSQDRRSEVKEQNPDMSNTDVSRLLGEMWRTASVQEKRPYVEREAIERAEYKEQTKKWKDEQNKLEAESRTSHASVQAQLDASVNKRHREKDMKNIKSVRDKTPKLSFNGEGYSRSVDYDSLHHHKTLPSETRSRTTVFRSYNGPVEAFQKAPEASAYSHNMQYNEQRFPMEQHPHRPQPYYPHELRYMNTSSKGVPPHSIQSNEEQVRSRSYRVPQPHSSRQENVNQGTNRGLYPTKSNDAIITQKNAMSNEYHHHYTSRSYSNPNGALSKADYHPNLHSRQPVHQSSKQKQPQSQHQQHYVPPPQENFGTSSHHHYQNDRHLNGPSPPPPPPPRRSKPGSEMPLSDQLIPNLPINISYDDASHLRKPQYYPESYYPYT